MAYFDVCEAVTKVKKKYDEPNPVRLCRQMGITLLYESFGKDPDAIKGFFTEMNRIKMITVNSDLPEIIQKIIIAHELGHAVMHRSSGVREFHDVAMFDESSTKEKDANLFAADYLLDDQAVFETLNEDTTFFTAAAKLHVPIELLDFKFRVMKWKGYKLIEPPITAQNNFLANMEVPDDADCYCD